MGECRYCERIACVCSTNIAHDLSCLFRIATSGVVAVECEHGYDCCPKCDPCTCAAKEAPDA